MTVVQSDEISEYAKGYNLEAVEKHVQFECRTKSLIPVAYLRRFDFSNAMPSKSANALYQTHTIKFYSIDTPSPLMPC